jgi:hypothetical protein
MGTGSFPGVKRPGRDADHSLLLAPRSRKSRAIPLTLLWAFGSVRGTFTFTILLKLIVKIRMYYIWVPSSGIIFSLYQISWRSISQFKAGN